MAAPSDQPDRIFVRSVNWLGDAVMTTPALLRLREAYPLSRITLACPAKLQPLWEHHPAVNETLPLGRESPLALGKRLKGHGYDLALIFPNSLRTALEAWAARIPRRVGYAGNGRSPLLTTVVPRDKTADKMRKRSVQEIKQLVRDGVLSANPAGHHIHQYLRLVEEVGGSSQPLAPRLAVAKSEQSNFQKKWDIAAPVCGLIPGAEYGPAKRLPAEKFVEAILGVQRRVPTRWLIFGAAADREIAREIESSVHAQFPGIMFNLAGETSLRELMAGLSVCKVVLTNDTGPMHVAAAVGTPVVAMFGSTSPELTAPGLPGNFPGALIRQQPPCSPCFLRECPIDFRCLKEIRSSEIAEAVLRLVNLFP